MFRAFRSPPQGRGIGLLAGLVVGSLLSAEVALADGAPVASPPAGATPVVVTPKADNQSLIAQLPGDDDAVMVAGVAAVTVLGLTGLALLDRRPPVTEQDGSDFE